MINTEQHDSYHLLPQIKHEFKNSQLLHPWGNVTATILQCPMQLQNEMVWHKLYPITLQCFLQESYHPAKSAYFHFHHVTGYMPCCST